MSIKTIDSYLKEFFETEKKALLDNYPGLNIHRLRIELEQHAFLNGVETENLFDAPYLPSRKNPITIFFNKLADGVPLEYITGYSYFYRSYFKVTKDVLIPRNETEILVEMAVTEINRSFKNKPCRVIDVGTGSGAIALSVVLDAQAKLELVASDISPKALRLAKENFYNQQFSYSNHHKVKFIESDRLSNIEGTFDFILTNPPYIKRKDDLKTVHSQVQKYEPHLALFLDDESYDEWFNVFLKQILLKLNAEGICFMEGHENHLVSLAEIAKSLGFSKATVVKDYTNRDRFLKLQK